MTKTKRHRPILLAIILIGFALRIHHLDRVPFRGDEAFTVQYWIITPLSETINQQLTVDPQPLLAYASYHLWGNWMGIGEFLVRMLPVLIATLGIPAIYRLSYELTQRRIIGLLTALGWALHPFLIWHSQDARNYALWSSTSVISLWLALHTLHRDRPHQWVILIVVSAVSAYLYYLELFMFAAVSVYVLLAYTRTDRAKVAKWILAMITVGAILAPWYLQPQLLSGGGYGGTTTGFDPLKLLTQFPTTLLFGVTLPITFQSGLWFPLVLLALLGLGVYAAYHLYPTKALFTFLVAITPVLMLAIVTLRLNVLAPRYVLGTIPGLLILVVGLGIWLYEKSNVWRVVSVLFLTGWITLNLLSVWHYYTDYAKTPNWIALTHYLNTHVEPHDLVIQAAADASFGYYYHQVYAIPADERALPADPTQPAAEIESELAQVSDRYDSLWIAAQGFTDWQNYGVLENWLDQNMLRIIDTRTDGLRIQQYIQPEATAQDTPPLAVFNQAAALVDMNIITPPQPTGELTVHLRWTPQSTTLNPLTVFVHLIDANTGELVAQDDHPPQHGRITTITWDSTQTYADAHHLPNVSALPAGSYQLAIGLYEPQTGDRLTTATGQDAFTTAPFQLP